MALTASSLPICTQESGAPHSLQSELLRLHACPGLHCRERPRLWAVGAAAMRSAQRDEGPGLDGCCLRDAVRRKWSPMVYAFTRSWVVAARTGPARAATMSPSQVA